MEFVVVVAFRHFFHQFVELCHCPAVQFHHVFRRHQIIGIETVEVAKAVAGGVSELQIALSELFKDLVGAADIHMVIGRAGPEAEHVCTVFIGDLSRIHAVAERLVHGTAFAVHGPSVSDALFKRSAFSQCADCCQQGRLEPSTVLIQTLEIYGGRPEALVMLHGSKVGGAGIEPSVQSIFFFGEVLAAAVRANKAFGKDLVCLVEIPCIGTFFGKQCGNGIPGLVGDDRFAAVFAVKYRNGEAPFSLTGDAPVHTLVDHGFHAVLAPFGNPADLVTCIDGVAAEGVHGAEPLRSGTEDDLAVTAPAVRIAVENLLRCEQRAVFSHVFQDDGVGLRSSEPCVFAGIFGVSALIIHRDDHLGVIAAAGLEVLCTKAGSGVNTSGTGIHGDIVCQHDKRGLRQERMICQHVLKEAAGMTIDHFVLGKAALFHDGFHQSFGHDVDLAVAGFHQNVVIVGVQRDAEVAGKRPDRGGPDHEVDFRQIDVGKLAQIIVDGELYEYRGTGIVFILDLCFCQCSLVVGAPVNRLEALVDIALLVHLTEDLDFFCFELRIHGLVGMLPVANDADAFEAVHLNIDVMLGKVMTGVAELRGAHGFPVQLVLLNDCRFNGHAVVVPSGDIRSVVSAHGIGAGDEILDGFVQSMSHVRCAVGERRAVMQVEQRFALVLLEHFII